MKSFRVPQRYILKPMSSQIYIKRGLFTIDNPISTSAFFRYQCFLSTISVQFCLCFYFQTPTPSVYQSSQGQLFCLDTFLASGLVHIPFQPILAQANSVAPPGAYNTHWGHCAEILLFP
jgi:hypothetical protein